MTTDTSAPRAELPYEELKPKERRLRLYAALARPMAGGIAVVVLYYVMPLDKSFDAATGSLFLLGLVGVGLVVLAQVRQIMHSRYPRLRAIGALAISVPLFLVLFSTVYFLIAQGNDHAFTETLSRTDSLYFTITVFSTVGFGDIAPKLEAARIVVMVQMIGDLILIGLIGKVLLGAVSLNLQRNRPPQQP